jgi:hypothetical protein
VPGCAALAADLCHSGSLELARLCFFVRLPNPRDAQTAWRMSTGGINHHWTANLRQHIRRHRSKPSRGAVADGSDGPYCAYLASNTPVNGGTYTQRYQWSQCLCSTDNIDPSTLKDCTNATICNSTSSQHASCQLLPITPLAGCLSVRFAVCQCARGT